MNKKVKHLILLLLCVLFVSAGLRTDVQAADSPSSSKCTIVLCGKMKEHLNFAGIASAKITKKPSKKIATVKKVGTNVYRITAKKNGTTTMKFNLDGNTLTVKIKVMKKGKKFLKAWSKQWVKNYIPKGASDYQKALYAASYASTLKYGKSNGSALDTIYKGKGTCVGGNAVVAQLLNTMHIKAKVRFAAKDNMKRYPSGVTFASQHYNVKATIKGKTYYLDGTPSSGFLYMSTSSKPVFYAFAMGDGYQIFLDEMKLFSN